MSHFKSDIEKTVIALERQSKNKASFHYSSFLNFSWNRTFIYNSLSTFKNYAVNSNPYYRVQPTIIFSTLIGISPFSASINSNNITYASLQSRIYVESASKNTDSAFTFAIPVHPGKLPVHTGIILVHSGMKPVYTGKLPVNSGIMPAHPGKLPVYASIMPVNPGMMLVHPGKLPVRSGMIHEDTGFQRILSSNLK